MIDKVLNYEFVLVFLFLSVIFLFFTIYIKKQKIKIILLIGFSVFFSLGVTEYILSFKDKINPGLNFEIQHIKNIGTIKVAHEILVLDSNKQMRKLRDSHHDIKFRNLQKLYDITFSQYDNKVRFTKCNMFSKYSYVFLGCSYVFGDGVNDNETLPYYFSELMNFKKNVINYGVQGHSTTTANLILTKGLVYDLCPNKKIEHFFYSFIFEHIHRNFRILDPSDNIQYKNGQSFRIQQPFGFFKVFFARCHIFRKILLPKIEERNKNFYINYTIDDLKKMREIIENKYNSKLTIIVWACIQGEILDRLLYEKFDIIILPKDFQFKEKGYRLPDLHPNSKANKEIAKILYNHINRTNIVN